MENNNNILTMPAYYAALDDSAMELVEGGGYVSVTFKASFIKRIVSIGADAAGRLACKVVGISTTSVAGKAIRAIVSSHYSAMTKNVKDIKFSVWAPIIEKSYTIG